MMEMFNVIVENFAALTLAILNKLILLVIIGLI